MKTLSILFFSIFCTGLTVFAQSIQEPKPSIDITGTAEKEIIPDEIYVHLTIRERMEGKDRITLETQEKNFKELLKKLGIDLSQLSLSDANADYVKIKYKKKDVLAQVSYSLKLSTAKMVGDLFSGLYEEKIFDAYISKVSHSKLEEYKRELRILAIKNAKEKAEYLTQAIGYQIGKPITIYENAPVFYQNNYDNMPQRMAEVQFKGAASSEESVPEISFKKIKLEASIFVKFEVK